MLETISNVMTSTATSDQCRDIDIQSRDIVQKDKNLDVQHQKQCGDINIQNGDIVITTKIQWCNTKMEPRHHKSDVATLSTTRAESVLDFLRSAFSASLIRRCE